MLQHGLLDSSFSFILNLPNESLAYIMADEGYDVWVTNNRGNRYSKEHKDWIPSDDIRFWDFTWDQFAEFDLPANVEYIKSNTKKEKIIYIGHSQGTTQFFAQMTMNNTFQNNFKIFFGLGPVIYANHQVINKINKV